MARKNPKLCSFRGCRKLRKQEKKWCEEHYLARWSEDELTISRPVMRDVVGKIHLLVQWNEKSSDFMHDLVEILKRKSNFNLMVNPQDRNNGWMLMFEAEKWQKGLVDDVHTCLDEITDLIYPEGMGH